MDEEGSVWGEGVGDDVVGDKTLRETVLRKKIVDIW